MLDEPPRKHILLVDDEPGTRQIVERALRRDLPGTHVTGVDSGGEALRALTRERVDLLITSLSMPVIDGIELLRHVVNRRLAVPVLALGGPADGAARLSSPALAVLPEPVEIDRLVKRARELMSERPGPARRIGLRELVQLVALTRRTCALRAAHGDQQGVLYFTAGALVDARAGELHGEPAALAILMWQDALTTFDLLLRARPVTIEADLDDLLRAIDRLPEPPPPPPPAPPPPPPPPAPAAWEDPQTSAALARLVAEAMTIEGALGAGLAVWELDHILGAHGSLGPAPIEAAVSGNCRVMRALLTTLHRLGLRTGVHDVLITLDQQLHILTPLPRHDELFLYLAVDRARGNLALTRHRVQKLLAELPL